MLENLFMFDGKEKIPPCALCAYEMYYDDLMELLPERTNEIKDNYHRIKGQKVIKEKDLQSMSRRSTPRGHGERRTMKDQNICVKCNLPIAD